MRVEDAHGQPPTIPFWLGEAPARSDELSYAVSRLRAELFDDAARCRRRPALVARRRRAAELHARCGRAAGRRLSCRARSSRSASLPTQDTIVLERFFDESGGMQLVIHAPFGSRINRAWGLALRKRFCVKFNFELQAAATEDAIVLSLSTSHSFPLADVARYLHSNSVREVADPGDARRADVRGALALDRRDVARAAALSRRQEGRRAAAADARRGPAGGGVSRPDRLRGEPRRRRARFPTIRWCGRRSTTACTRRWTSRGSNACCSGSSGRHRDRRARPAGAVAAGAGDPQRASVRVPRRRAARGAPHAGGHGAALGRRGNAGRARHARRRGDRRVRAEAWPDAASRRRAARRVARSWLHRRGRGGEICRMARRCSQRSRRRNARRD